MWIRTNLDNLHSITAEIDKTLADSRFTAKVFVKRLSNSVSRFGVKIETVRLRVKKDYCGGHPGPCPVLPWPWTRKHMKRSLLEGLDWVGFNAMLNDLFDRLNWDADIWSYNREALPSGNYYIRKGRCRRVSYPYEERVAKHATFHHWTLGGNFEDYCGKQPPSLAATVMNNALDDTPGIPAYTQADADAWIEEFGLEHSH